MKLKEYFLTILRCLNPDSHKDVVKMPLFGIFKYLMFLMVLSGLVSLALLIPGMQGIKSGLNQDLSSFDEFTIDATTELSQPIVLAKSPRIVVDFEKEELTNEWILINEEKAMFEKFLFFGYDEMMWDDYKDATNQESSDLYFKIILFLLPALMFWYMAALFVKYFVLVLILSVLGWIFFVSGKTQVTFEKSFKVAMLTLTPLIIFDLAIWPIRLMLVIPLVIYIIYFVIGLVMVSERKYRHKSGGHKAHKKDHHFWDDIKEKVEKNN